MLCKLDDGVPMSFQVSSGVGGSGGASDGPDGREGGLSNADRETGIVEKLLSTYGFIRCCDRQARLFFHYSQFSGTVDHLKVGDAVDFEMTFDKKSGKPIAVAVAKLCSDPTLGMGPQLVTGWYRTCLLIHQQASIFSHSSR